MTNAEAMTQPTLTEEERRIMGTLDEAQTKLLECWRAWTKYTGPAIADRKTHRERDAARREAEVRLRESAATVAWHLDRLTNSRPSPGVQLGCKICGATVLDYNNARELLKDGPAFNFKGNRASQTEGSAQAASSPTAQQPPDDPSLDCTDAAHPAWWRGQDYGFNSLCREVNKILDNPKEPLAGVCNEPWQSLRVRLHSLVNSPPAPTREQVAHLLEVFAHEGVDNNMGYYLRSKMADAILALFNAGSVK